MSPDLFATDTAPRRLAIEDADVRLWSRIDLPAPAEDLLQGLIATTPWRAESIVLWGRRYLQPRLIAWYGDPGRRYAYSGLDLEPLPWTPVLASVRDAVQDIARTRFDSVLLNYYRDHRDSMGLHSDDEPELGPMPVIASLSLGATRRFVLKHKSKAGLAPVRLDLPSGSLLLMAGSTQRCWKHGIGKQARPCGPRVNLTFRRIDAGLNDRVGASQSRWASQDRHWR